MKKISNYLLLFVLTISMTSCLVDDTDPTAEFDQGPNVAGFSNQSTDISGTTDGSSYDFELPMSVVGPTSSEYTEDITVTISIDPSSTAVEGTNFELPSKTLVLPAGADYMANLPITLLTTGITAPLEEAPVLVLSVTTADGETNLLPNGKKLTITLNYLCFSDLAGNYAWGTFQPSLDLVQVSEGVYRMPYLANFGSVYWFEFKDVCGVLTITDWEYQGGNPITQNEPGYIGSNGEIVFPSVDVAGVDWFVGLDLTYTKN